MAAFLNRRLTLQLQIEQFIEKIFPTQDVAKLSAEDKAKAKQREAEQSVDRKEAVILIGAVLLVLVFVGGLMVSCRTAPRTGPKLNSRIGWHSVVHGSPFRRSFRKALTRQGAKQPQHAESHTGGTPRAVRALVFLMKMFTRRHDIWLVDPHILGRACMAAREQRRSMFINASSGQAELDKIPDTNDIIIPFFLFARCTLLRNPPPPSPSGPPNHLPKCCVEHRAGLVPSAREY